MIVSDTVNCAKVYGFPKGREGNFVKGVFEFSFDMSDGYLERAFQARGRLVGVNGGQLMSECRVGR